MTKIILERHGESMANALHVYAGHGNFPLSELGQEQATAAANALADEHIDAIYSSDLDRAYQTALAHARLRGIEVTKRCGLREIDIGEWDSKPRDFLMKKYPYEAKYIWQKYFGLFRAPGGESAPDAGKRFCDELAKIAEENDGKTVLVAAHAAVIRLSWGRIMGYEDHQIAMMIPFPTNASFSYLEYDSGHFVTREYSVDKHIKNIKSEPLK